MFKSSHTSLNVNEVILKLTYLPAISVARSLDSKSLLDPVMNNEVFSDALREFTTFSHDTTF